MAGESQDGSDRPGAFLHRWSRRKHEASRGAVTAPAPGVAPAAESAGTAPSSAVPAPVIAAGDPTALATEPAPLPPVESLTIESDFTPFLAKKVDETVKRAALRKLFSDPHFNVMDGLDVYIDDYSKPDPVPPGFLDKLADVYKSVEEKAADLAHDDANAPGDAMIATTTAETPASGAPVQHPAQDPPSSQPAPSAPRDEHRG